MLEKYGTKGAFLVMGMTNYDRTDTSASTSSATSLYENENPGLEQYLDAINKYEAAFSIHCNSVESAIKLFLARKNFQEPYLSKILGSKSRASELLNGKRNPSLSDIRALRTHLGMPADLLIALSEKSAKADMPYDRFPTSELVKRGVIPEELKTKPKEAYKFLASTVGIDTDPAELARLRQSPRKNAKSDALALRAWLMCVLAKARLVPVHKEFDANEFKNFMLGLAAELSPASQGAGMVESILANNGVRFVVEPHLKSTYLDGAALYGPDDIPIVALTGRYDRLDNFWFTLLHEAAHLALGHVAPGKEAIVDDLDIAATEGEEAEADRLARNAAIPEGKWVEFPLETCRLSDIYALAMECGISPAIVAGRVRFERRNYRIFTGLVGAGEVRRQFPIAFPARVPRPRAKKKENIG